MKVQEFREMVKEKKTWDEMKSENQKTGFRRKPRDIEHNLQRACVTWFHCVYPDILLFAVPNGGKRDARTAAKLKAEGQTPGVADLILQKACKGYHFLAIEMKTTEKGSRQSDKQKEYQEYCKREGYKYVICHTIEEFVKQVKDYLK